MGSAEPQKKNGRYHFSWKNPEIFLRECRRFEIRNSEFELNIVLSFRRPSMQEFNPWEMSKESIARPQKQEEFTNRHAVLHSVNGTDKARSHAGGKKRDIVIPPPPRGFDVSSPNRFHPRLPPSKSKETNKQVAQSLLISLP